MVAGGYRIVDAFPSDIVELVSLDPVNHPIPSCLGNPSPLAVNTSFAAGASLTAGIAKFN